ncbi:MAG TPA: NAD-dependent epimerase/dehydratase family protein [Gemmatimonadaceae bacterium]|nr:NAD-dependent epimerase/dehydratase family protein [Gemmatimonadaceae bacterium]
MPTNGSSGSTTRGGAKRALVTGGAGFIGSHVADAYIANGYHVVVLDNLSSGNRDNVPQGAEFVEGDIASADAARLVREGRFDVISHLAAQIDVRKSVADPAFDAAVNIVGTVNLLEALRASGGRGRFVFSSTGGALYGDFVTPPNEEEFPKDPESPYGIAKLSAEYYMAYYGRLHGLETVALRYANVYGPRQNPHGEAGVVAIFCSRILEHRALTVFGDGLQTRDYVFVGDVARANVAAATRPIPPAGRLDARGFNIGTGVGTSVVDLARRLTRVAGSEVPVEHSPARPGEQQRSVVKIDKAASVLGWRPEVALDQGLTETFRWFADRRAAEPAVAAPAARAGA